MTASDKNIYSLNGKTSRGIELPTLWNIFTIMAFHRPNQLAYYVFFITFLTYVYLHTTGPRIWIHFHLHSPVFTSFLHSVFLSRFLSPDY